MGTLAELLLSTNMSKSSSILFLVAVASWLVCVQSQKVFFGACPTVTPMANFDMSQYAKAWYERQKYCTIGQIGQRCIVATITDKGSDSPFQPPCYFRERSNSGEWNGRADNRFLHARESFGALHWLFYCLELYRLRIYQYPVFVDLYCR